MKEAITNQDREFLHTLWNFLPGRIFDAHAHLFPAELFSNRPGAWAHVQKGDAAEFMQASRILYGDRPVQAMFLPYPMIEMNVPQCRNRVNAWMAEQLDTVRGCVAQAYVLPGDTKKDVEALLIHPGIRGFKCYYTTACGNAGDQSDISEYLPESVWEVANERKLCITLHLVKTLSAADPENQKYVSTMCRRYADTKLVLAHCARGFAPWTVMEAARKWEGIGNLYYDLSAICEPEAMTAVIRSAGADHVMWGTDYALSHMHNRPYVQGTGFVWRESTQENPCAMLVLESLHGFYQAAKALQLTRKQIEDIFCNNALRLLL